MIQSEYLFLQKVKPVRNLLIFLIFLGGDPFVTLETFISELYYR